jgi:hypothetical protein
MIGIALLCLGVVFVALGTEFIMPSEITLEALLRQNTLPPIEAYDKWTGTLLGGCLSLLSLRLLVTKPRA